MLRRSSVLWLGGIVAVGFFLFSPQERRRRLLTAGYVEYTDWFSGESLATVNGNVPSLKCPIGSYRPVASSDSNFQRLVGFRTEGCALCPVGYYGEEEGLISAACTADCPLGTYNDKPGATSAADCQLCPPGTYGSRRGLTTSKCSGFCPSGTFSNDWGLTSSSDCKPCIEGYNEGYNRGWKCSWGIVAQHFAGVRAHHYDLDNFPAAKLRGSSVRYRKAANHPKPVDFTIPFEIPLHNEISSSSTLGS